jgi:hypothetical protein
MSENDFDERKGIREGNRRLLNCTDLQLRESTKKTYKPK